MSDEPSPQQHYFDAAPAVASREREMRVRLLGREVDVLVDAGVFSGGRLDTGTGVLLRYLSRTASDTPVPGPLLDLGCGWGPIALALAMTYPDREVWAVDVNERARSLLRRSAKRLGLDGIQVAAPDDVPADLRFAQLWSNPPVRIGRPALQDLLVRWLPRVADAGSSWLVIGRNLGADPLAQWLSSAPVAPDGRAPVVEKAGSAKGFRVLRVTSRPATD